MTEIEIDTDGVAFGQWLSIESLWALIEPMSLQYQRRFAKWYIGNEDDLAQSASLALVEWCNANEGADRIRELIGLELVHNAMIAEIRSNRRSQSIEDDPLLFGLVDDRRQLSAKQNELREYAVRRLSGLAGNRYWEAIWLALALGWDHQQVVSYWKRKKDDRRSPSLSQFNRWVKEAKKRIVEGLDDLTVVEDVLLLELNRCE